MRLFSIAMLALASVGVTSQPFSCFPRMRDTESILPYERRMPDPPRGTVPFAQDTPSPTARDRITAGPATARPRPGLGSYYYEYYCETCHGARGEGNGLVGRSYVPSPPPLATARVKGLAPRRLAEAMVQGVGHEPVLSATVPRDRREAIAAYVQSLRPMTPPSYPRELAAPQQLRLGEPPAANPAAAPAPTARTPTGAASDRPRR